MPSIRPCGTADLPALFSIINDAAQAYKGIIPADRWRDPYMLLEELEREIHDGVAFWVCESGGELVGVMGIHEPRQQGFSAREPHPPGVRWPPTRKERPLW